MLLKLGILSVCLVLPCCLPLCAAQAPAEQSQELASHLQQAQNYLHQKQPELAIPELEAAVRIDPNNAEAQGNLGVLLYFRGSFREAVPHLHAALVQRPGLAKLQGLLGIAELRTSAVENARKDLEAAFPSIPDKKFKVQVGLELVGIYTQSGDLEAALPTIAELRKTDPGNAEVLYAAYRTYTDLSSESMLALGLAAPGSAQMHQLLAHEEIREGNTNAALAEYRKAIAIDPHLPGVHFELAELLNSAHEQERKQQAVQEYQAALSVNPMDEKAQRRLAEIDTQEGNTVKATEELKQAIKLDPADADAKLDLAKLLTEESQQGTALALLQSAIELDPTNATAHYRLSLLYRKKGDAEKSKRELESYRKLKEEKEKLRATYKDLLIKPNEIASDEQNER